MTQAFGAGWATRRQQTTGIPGVLGGERTEVCVGVGVGVGGGGGA